MDAAGDLGFDEARKKALRSWLKQVELEDELRQRRGELRPSTIRFMTGPSASVPPEMQALIDKELADVVARQKREKGGG